MASINTCMPAISRHKDRCRTGHKCSATAPVNSSQSSVFANGIPILRRGDKVAFHFIKFGIKCIPHKNAKLTGSSRSVFVKGIAVGRKGDRADFGAMTGASFNVFAG